MSDSKIKNVILWPVKLFVALLAAFAFFVVDDWRTWNYGYAIFAVYCVLLCNCVADLLYGVYYLIRKRGSAKNSKADPEADLAIGSKLPDRRRRRKAILLLTVIISACYLAYGYYNMTNVVPNYREYTSNKLKNTYKFVFVSDTHTSTGQDIRTTNKVFEQIADERPDFIVLGGDITDQYTSRADMIELYRNIGGLGIPTYFIYGNHDRTFNAPDYSRVKSYTDEELDEAIEANGIRILQDDYEVWADDLVLLGRDDEGSTYSNKILDYSVEDSPMFTLLFEHNPYNSEEIAESGADLQVSGHSHGGQLFPMALFFDKLGFNCDGEYHYGKTTLLVSPGASGWLIPFKTGAHSSYEVVTIGPN